MEIITEEKVKFIIINITALLQDNDVLENSVMKIYKTKEERNRILLNIPLIEYMFLGENELEKSYECYQKKIFKYAIEFYQENNITIPEDHINHKCNSLKDSLLHTFIPESISTDYIPVSCHTIKKIDILDSAVGKIAIKYSESDIKKAIEYFLLENK